MSDARDNLLQEDVAKDDITEGFVNIETASGSGRAIVLAQVDGAIGIHQQKIDVTPNGSADLPLHLFNLGISFGLRFSYSGDQNDIERSMSTLRRAVDLTSDDHPDKPVRLNYLGIAFGSLFDTHNELEDIEKAIPIFQHAAGLAPDDHNDKPEFLGNLGSALMQRYDWVGSIDDIEKAILSLQQAVDITPEDHGDKPEYFNKLGTSLWRRYNRFGEIVDIEKAILAHQRAVDLTTKGDSVEPAYLNNLGNALQSRFEHLGNFTDIERAIDMHQQIVDQLPDNITSKRACLNSLGRSLRIRYERRSSLSDLEKAVAAHQKAVDLTPDGHAEKPTFLSNLSHLFRMRFDRQGSLEDLEKAVLVIQQAIHFTPDGHVGKASLLSSFGVALSARFNFLGELTDIEKAIFVQQQAVDLTPEDHATMPGRLDNLGNSLLNRFNHCFDPADIENAIRVHQHAVDLTPDADSNKPGRLNNLSNTFQSRFDRYGGIADIDRAIAVQRHAADLTPDRHVDKPGQLHNLANSLQSRFARFKERQDIEAAIFNHRFAIKLLPEGHSRRTVYFKSFNSSLQKRFHHFGERADVDEAIAVLQRCIDLTPNSHVYKVMLLDSLGIAFACRYNHLDELGDIEKAVFALQQAVNLLPDGDLSKPVILNNLVTSFLSCPDHNFDFINIDSAITVQQQAVDLTPDGYIGKADMFRNLGTSLKERFSRHSDRADLNRALAAYQQAANLSYGTPSTRLNAALDWADTSLRQGSHDTSSAEDKFPVHDIATAFRAYDQFMQLIPEVIWLGQKVHHRLGGASLSRIGRFVNAAALLAISNGENPRALGWLEASRNIVWGQILQLRTPVDELRTKDRDLANDLETTARALESANTSENIGNFLNPSSSIEVEAQKQHVLAEKYDALISRVRQLDGFQNFLGPKKLEQLAPAAEKGPVVVVSSFGEVCFALILNRRGCIVDVHLKDFTNEQAEDMRTDLLSCLRYDGIRNRGQYQLNALGGRNRIPRILGQIWRRVVEPVLLKLDDKMVLLTMVFPKLSNASNKHEKPHITWCPTGALAFLPLHAAGIYNNSKTDSDGGKKLVDHAISSYTPSLNAILPTADSGVPLECSPAVVAVSHPDPPGYSPIYGTLEEIKMVQKLFRNLTWINQEQATVASVLDSMEKHSILHLACHGFQNAKAPMKSAFILSDGTLTIEDLMKKELKNVSLAFLSACQTATGDEKLPEEAVHLAAGMLAAGYQSVVSTMWAIQDGDACIVANAFYSKLKEYYDEGKDWRVLIAHAMHYAVDCLRKEIGEDEYLRWIPFVHFGK